MFHFGFSVLHWSSEDTFKIVEGYVFDLSWHPCLGVVRVVAASKKFAQLKNQTHEETNWAQLHRTNSAQSPEVGSDARSRTAPLDRLTQIITIFIDFQFFFVIKVYSMVLSLM